MTLESRLKAEKALLEIRKKQFWEALANMKEAWRIVDLRYSSLEDTIMQVLQLKEMLLREKIVEP